MRRENRLRTFLIIGLAAVAALSLPVLVMAISFDSSQLTNNIVPDSSPRISGNNIIWKQGDGTDDEIVLYNGSTTTTLTNNSFFDGYPEIDNEKAVWNGVPDGTDMEVYYYDGNTVSRLTTNNTHDNEPKISGNKVVWGGNDGDGEIFIFDGTTTTQQTTNTWNDDSPRINGNEIVWRGAVFSGDNEIFFYDGNMLALVTSNVTDDSEPDVSNGLVVWHNNDGGDPEIMKFDFDNLASGTVPLTNNGYWDDGPRVDNGKIVWRGGVDPGNTEIFLYENGVTTRLTNNNYDDFNQIISGPLVAWQGQVGGFGSDFEIFVYHGGTVTRLTDNNYDDQNPRISGNKVVWEAYITGPPSDFEIMTATLGNTPQGTPVTVNLGDVSVIYQQVDAFGDTTAAIGPPLNGPPAGVSFIGDQYNITTNAEFSNSVTVTLNYDENQVGDENVLKLYHWNGASWDDVTSNLDIAGNQISGQVNSLSPFILGSSTPPTGVNIGILFLIGLVCLAVGALVISGYPLRLFS